MSSRHILYLIYYYSVPYNGYIYYLIMIILKQTNVIIKFLSLYVYSNLNELLLIN